MGKRNDRKCLLENGFPFHVGSSVFKFERNVEGTFLSWIFKNLTILSRFARESIVTNDKDVRYRMALLFELSG